MNLLLNQVWMQHIGWTLIQFLWQGTLISVLFAIARGILGRSLTAHARYILACCTLAAMVAAPVATFVVKPSAPPLTAWPLPSPDSWQPILPWLVLTWLGGVLVFSARLIGGWRHTARMRSHGVRPAPPEWQAALEQLIHRVGVSRPVRLLISSLVEVPTVIGWLQPVVLVPVGALTGLPAEHVQALLAHELAHIRRQDYLVNILQSIAEAVLFYHPAVWWMSDQIRTERELCCDDLAVAVSGDVLTYARALAELESYRPSRAKVALAANGGSLLNRIRRLIGTSEPVSHTLPGPGAVGAMSLLWLVGIGAVAAHGAPVAPPKPVSSPVAVTAPLPVVLAAAVPQHRILSAFLYGPFGPSPEPQAPPPAPPAAEKKTARLEGTVLSTTGGPVPRASVQLIGGGIIARTTDEMGKFVFEDVAPGPYALQAARAGFITSYATPTGGSRPLVTLESGQTLKDMVVKLIPQGIVAGQVTNQDRDPVEGATVTIYRSTYVRGRRQLARAGGVATNDEGNFRIANLLPGRYYLGVQPAGTTSPGPRIFASADGPTVSFDLGNAFAAGFAAGSLAGGATAAQAQKGIADVPTFYPNGLEAANAVPLEISAGSHVERIDIRLRRERVYSVRGKVDWNGSPIQNAATLAVTRRDGELTMPIANTAIRQGTFEVNNLLPGAYVLQSTVSSSTALFQPIAPAASPGRGGAGLLTSGTSFSARIEVTVGNSNVDGIVLSMQPNVTLTGTFKSDEGDLQSLLNSVASTNPQNRVIRPGIALQREDGSGNTGQATNKDDGTFQLAEQTAPGRYLLGISRLADNFYVKSIRFAGQDITNAPLELTAGGGSLEIVLSAKAASISGVLHNEKGEPLSGVTVAIWPKTLNLGSSTLGVKSVTTDQNGSFKTTGLPPGDYSVAGWESEGLNSSLIQIPDLLARLANEATAVKLSESAQASVDAKLISAAKITAELAKLP